jgi:hypothetical protein
MEEAIPLFNKQHHSQKESINMLSSSSRATSASKCKVFSPSLDNFVDSQIMSVLDQVQLKKTLDKTRIQLTVRQSQLKEEVASL